MSTPSFKTCPAGHYFAASLPACPYCTDQGTANVGGSPLGSGSGDEDKTRLMSDQGTATFSPPAQGNETAKVNVPPPAIKSPAVDNDRTMIRPPATTGEDNSRFAGNQEQARLSRKLTGWLVSFTIDPMGLDFRLYEGQNPVGRDISCSVRIIQDGSISSRHATILFRNGNFYLRDEMATNPSYVNGQEIPPGATQEVKDGDRLRFGDSEFLLRTAY